MSPPFRSRSSSPITRQPSGPPRSSTCARRRNMDQLHAYWPLYPELILVIGAMALLMLGVFRPEGEREAETIGWLAIGVLGLAAWFVLQQPAGTQRLFGGA